MAECLFYDCNCPFALSRPYNIRRAGAAVLILGPSRAAYADRYLSDIRIPVIGVVWQ